MLKRLLKERLPVSSAEAPHDQQATPTLSYQEKNIVRYVSGYIPRNVLDQIKTSAHKNKQDLRMCMLDVLEELGMDDDSDDDESLDWLRRVNRGGLLNVGVKMYNCMCAMEIEIKTFLEKKGLV